MIIRTLSLAIILLAAQPRATAQTADVTPAHYAEAQVAWLDELLKLTPEQVVECRRMLVEHESQQTDTRQGLRAMMAQLEEQQREAWSGLNRSLTTEQAEKLLRATKQGVPVTMDTAEPGSTHGHRKEDGTQGTPPEKKGATSGKPASSPTTLSR
ncbi:MAG: hypothetical protein IPJ87_09225 [Flavobacteriales bacterium]|jgi:hypothetical protein|nr:hypothetical protein [Flavobacteriales bacterium]MBK7942042.1 hypothetical protein [Flavobacteriales bacterium]MBK8947844.1 hypothetical protein [Flavobacteriales bacterium]MBK9700587.1 hypothetical protein [Flavobacteriales bacterium]